MPRWKGIDIHDLQRTVFNRPLVALWNMAGHRSFVRHTDRCKQSIPREIEQRYRCDISYLLVPAASKDYVSLPDIYMVVGVTMACHSRNYVSGMQRTTCLQKEFPAPWTLSRSKACRSFRARWCRQNDLLPSFVECLFCHRHNIMYSES